MKEPKLKTDGLLLKGLLALSISATPMFTWAGVNSAEASSAACPSNGKHHQGCGERCTW